MKCKDAVCPRTVKNNRWAKTRAHSEGWFFSRDNEDAYCPDHVPEWVAGWREARA